MKAKWHGQPFFDTSSRKYLITFEVDALDECFDKTKDKELRLEVSEYKEKRGLNANAYFWILVNKIAIALNVTDTEVHDKLLADNINYIYANDAIDFTVRDWTPNKYRFVKQYGEGNNYEYWIDSLMVVRLAKPDGSYYMANGKPKESKIFWHIKGSHQMDSKEMSRLIDCTVEEAKALGIETMTPAELERMIKAWVQKKSWLK